MLFALVIDVTCFVFYFSIIFTFKMLNYNDNSNIFVFVLYQQTKSNEICQTESKLSSELRLAF